MIGSRRVLALRTLPVVIVAYVLVTAISNLQVISPWMLVFPVYALLQVLLMILSRSAPSTTSCSRIAGGADSAATASGTAEGRRPGSERRADQPADDDAPDRHSLEGSPRRRLRRSCLDRCPPAGRVAPLRQSPPRGGESVADRELHGRLAGDRFGGLAGQAFRRHLNRRRLALAECAEPRALPRRASEPRTAPAERATRAYGPVTGARSCEVGT